MSIKNKAVFYGAIAATIAFFVWLAPGMVDLESRNLHRDFSAILSFGFFVGSIYYLLSDKDYTRKAQSVKKGLVFLGMCLVITLPLSAVYIAVWQSIFGSLFLSGIFTLVVYSRTREMPEERI